MSLSISFSEEKILKKQKEIHEFWRQFLNQWKCDIEAFESDLKNMSIKHAVEMQSLVQNISKIIGVNFRYIRMSELPVTASQIIKQRQEISQRRASTKTTKLKIIKEKFERLFNMRIRNVFIFIILMIFFTLIIMIPVFVSM